MSDNEAEKVVRIASTAMARLKACVKDESMLNAHFTVDGQERFFQAVFEEASNAIHEEMHEQYDTCHPEQEGVMGVEERLLRFMFLLGRATEEFAVMDLAAANQLRFQP
jgi:hypothetical protein